MSLAIKVQNLSKAYQIGEFSTGTISRDIERWWAGLRGKEDPFLKVGEMNDRSLKGESNIVWSLKDLDFEIEQGDAVGIIGRNGAGKSTLLKLLSRVTSPTTGSIKVKGRIASLLEVGTGFHPELTGRENIFLNGAILGMRKKEIKRRFDEIVDFAGVERYIDTPVKRYSSGMYVRLAFAVAAHLESEILIVDEVLAVGDAEFQKKCLGKMGDVSKGEGRTVLFVSHNMGAILNLCNTAIVLKNGLLEKHSDAESCMLYYQRENKALLNHYSAKSKSGNPQLQKVHVLFRETQPDSVLQVHFTVASSGSYAPAFVAFDIRNGMGITISQAIPQQVPFIIFDGSESDYDAEVFLSGLIPDTYTLSVWIGPDYSHTYEWLQDVLSFEVINSPIENRSVPHHIANGSVISASIIKQ